MNKLILLDKSPIAGPRALAIAIVAVVIIAFLAFASLAKAAPSPELVNATWLSFCQIGWPLDNSETTRAKSLMVQRFQIPPDAIILEFWAKALSPGGSAAGAYMTWKTLSKDHTHGHISSRGYLFGWEIITAQTDFDF